MRAKKCAVQGEHTSMAGGENDARLVTAARQNRSAFVALYRRYLLRVYGYVDRRVGSQQDAEDVTALVFTEALESLENYREQGSFAGWLFTIAHHRVPTTIASRGRAYLWREWRPLYPSPAPGPGGPDPTTGEAGAGSPGAG